MKYQLQVILLVYFIINQSQSYPTATTTQFPLTIGGFQEYTSLLAFDIDSSNNIAIAGCTSDFDLTGIVSSQCMLYVLYITAGNAPYTWAQFYQIPVAQVNKLSLSSNQLLVTSTDSNGDVTISILDVNDGSIYMALQQQSTTIERLNGNDGAYAYFLNDTFVQFGSCLRVPGSFAASNFLVFAQFDIQTNINAGSSPQIIGQRYNIGSEYYTKLIIKQGEKQTFASVFIKNMNKSAIISLTGSTVNFVEYIVAEMKIEGLTVFSDASGDRVVFGYLSYLNPTNSNSCRDAYYLFHLVLSVTSDFITTNPVISYTRMQESIPYGGGYYYYWVCWPSKYLDSRADSTNSAYFLINIVGQNFIQKVTFSNSGTLSSSKTFSGGQWNSYPSGGLIVDASINDVYVFGSQSAYNSISLQYQGVNIGMVNYLKPYSSKSVTQNIAFLGPTTASYTIQCNSNWISDCSTSTLYGSSLTASLQWTPDQLTLIDNQVSLSTSPILTPEQTSPVSCRIQVPIIPQNEITVQYYNQSLSNHQPQPIIYSIDTAYSMIACNNTCFIKDVFFSSPNPYVTLIYDSTARTITVNQTFVYSTSIIIGCQSDYFMKSPSRSNCGYYYVCMHLVFTPPTIVSFQPVTMTTTLGDGSDVIQIFAPFQNTWNITNDPSVIIWSVMLDYSALQLNPLIGAYDNVTRTITLFKQSTSAVALVGQYYLYIRAQFKDYNLWYIPQYYFQIQIRHPCAKSNITTYSVHPISIYYMIGVDTQITFSFQPWTFQSLVPCPSPFSYDWISPSPSTFNTTSMQILETVLTLNTSNHLLTGSYNVTVRGYLSNPDPVSTMYNDTYFNVILSSSLISSINFAAPLTISMNFTVGDEIQQFILPAVSMTNTNLQFDSALYFSDGSIPNPLLFNFNGSQAVYTLQVNATDDSQVGTYQLRVVAWFKNYTELFNFSSMVFQVRVKNKCCSNIIKPPLLLMQGTSTLTGMQTNMFQYEITTQPKTFKIDPWESSKAVCNDFKYFAKQRNGEILPNSVVFDQQKLTLTVSTSSIFDEKLLQVMIQVNALYFDEVHSITSWIYDINIFCKTQSIKNREKSKIKQIFLQGSTTKLIVMFKSFAYVPACFSPQFGNQITYSSQLVTNEPLPSFIVFDDVYQNFTIQQNEQMIAQMVYTIKVQGVTQSGFKDSYTWDLQILEGAAFIDLSTTSSPSGTLNPNFDVDNPLFTHLKDLDITVFTLQKTQFNSKQFKSKYQLIITDVYLTFVTIIGQQLTVNPKKTDVGLQNVYLVAFDGTQGFIQKVNIYVRARKYYFGEMPVGFTITSISRQGIVTLMFNTTLQNTNVTNLTSFINNQSLSVKLIAPIDSHSIGYLKDWQVLNFTSVSLTLKLNFANQIFISHNGYDNLEVKVLNRSIFNSTSGIMIVRNFKQSQRIPKQLDNSSFSQSVDDLSVTLQTSINNFMGISTLANLFFSTLMSEIWGMISTIQLILQIPLCSVSMPANVQLIYYLIQYNFNLDFLNFDFFDFQTIFINEYAPIDNSNDGNSTRRRLRPKVQVQQTVGQAQQQFVNPPIQITERVPFSDSFYGQDIFSNYQHTSQQPHLNFYLRYQSSFIVENLMPVLNNINQILLITIFLRIIEFILVSISEDFKNVQKFKLYKDTRGYLLYTFLFSFMIQSSMQLSIFAMVNIDSFNHLDHSYPTSLEKYSMCTAVFIIMAVLAIWFYMTFQVYWAFMISKNQDSIEQSILKPIYEGLKFNQMSAMLYYPIYILRRFLVALAIVFLKNSPTAQIFCLIYLSLIMIGYLIICRPFDSELENNLEIVNELFAIASSYHMFIFTDFCSDTVMQYTIGWSLNLLIVVQFMLHTFIFVTRILIGVSRFLYRLVRIFVYTQCIYKWRRYKAKIEPGTKSCSRVERNRNRLNKLALSQPITEVYLPNKVQMRKTQAPPIEDDIKYESKILNNANMVRSKRIRQSEREQAEEESKLNMLVSFRDDFFQALEEGTRPSQNKYEKPPGLQQSSVNIVQYDVTPTKQEEDYIVI